MFGITPVLCVHKQTSVCLSCDRKCLDLVEALIRLADAGHYQPVVELFKFAGLRDKLFNEIQDRVAEQRGQQAAQ